MDRDYFLQSQRLGFSHWRQQDLPLAVSLWGDGEVSKYISKSGVFSAAQVKDKFAAECDRQQAHGISYWPIFFLESGEFVGCCGLRLFGLRAESVSGEFELGFHLIPRFWGQGLATEAAGRVIEYAFEKLKATTLFAGHNPHNVKSKTVLERLGFIYQKDNFFAPTGLMHPTYSLEKHRSDKKGDRSEA